MKKFNFKALLILVLVLVMVAALAACNPNEEKNNGGNGGTGGGGGGNNNPSVVDYTAGEYFDALWSMSKGIGGEEISKDDDVAVNMELELELGSIGVVKSYQSQKYSAVKLGLDLSMVLDRHSKDAKGNYTGKNTAVKLGLNLGTVDSSDGNVNKTVDNALATLYFFVNDPQYLYIDFAGSNAKVPFVMGGDGKGKGSLNESVGEYLLQFLTSPIDPAAKDSKSINDYIDLFAGDMGEGWSLNSLVNSVLALIPGFDLKAQLKTWLADPTMGGLFEGLGISEDVLFEENGNVNLLNVLKNETVGKFLKATKKAGNNGEQNYTLAVNTGLYTLLNTFVKGINALLGPNSRIEISFTETAEGTLKDGVNILAVFSSDSTTYQKQVPGLSTTRMVAPYVNIHIKHLNFKNATDKDLISINTEKYFENLALVMEDKIAINGMKIDTTPWVTEGAGAQYYLGEAVLHVEGKLNLNAVETDSPLDLYAYIGFTSAKEGATLDKLIEVSLTGKTMAIQINRDAAIDYDTKEGAQELKIFDSLINAAGPTIYSIVSGLLPQNAEQIEGFADVFFADETHKTISDKFNGIILDGISINWGFIEWGNGVKAEADKWLAESRAKNAPANSAEDAAASKINPTMIAKMLREAVQCIDAKDGKVAIKSSGLLGTISNFMNIFNNNSEWSEENSINAANLYVMSAYDMLGLMLNNNDKINDLFTDVPTRAQSNAFTVAEVAGIVFKKNYGHEYNEKTCTGADHAKCAANYKTITSVAEFFFNNKDANLKSMFADLTYNFVPALYEGANSDTMLKECLEGLKVIEGSDDLFGTVQKLVTAFPEAYAKYYFKTNGPKHEYNAETCKGADHEQCAQLYTNYKNEAILFVVAYNLLQEEATYTLLEKVAGTFLIEGVKFEGDANKQLSSVIAYLINNVVKAMPVELSFGFDEDGKLDASITVGFAGDHVHLVLSHHMELKEVEIKNLAPADLQEEGWYYYNFFPEKADQVKG